MGQPLRAAPVLGSKPIPASVLRYYEVEGVSFFLTDSHVLSDEVCAGTHFDMARLIGPINLKRGRGFAKKLHDLFGFVDTLLSSALFRDVYSDDCFHDINFS